MSEPIEVNIGDVVRLKSGGVAMTVKWIIDGVASQQTGREPGIVCQWHDLNGIPQETTYGPECSSWSTWPPMRDAMRLIIVESPYAGDVGRNLTYARRCLRHALERGEAAIASHVLYTQPGILCDDIPEQRELGIRAGYAWRRVCDISAFYTDLGWSNGMLQALMDAIYFNHLFVLRALDGPIKEPDGLTKREMIVIQNSRD